MNWPFHSCPPAKCKSVGQFDFCLGPNACRRGCWHVAGTRTRIVTSVVGTFETCRLTMGSSAHRGGSEVISQKSENDTNDPQRTDATDVGLSVNELVRVRLRITLPPLPVPLSEQNDA